MIVVSVFEELVVGDKKIVLREPRSISDYRELMDVQLRIWGMPDYSEAVTYHMIIAGHRNGGVVLGAFEEDTGRAIGLVYSVPAYRDGMVYLYSHLAGVVPEYRFLGIGYRLKLLQRRLALEKGYRLVEWTYDPMQSSNAFFNIVKLGVIVRKFYRDYYGELMDEINRGMPSDRFIAEWWIKSRRVEKALRERIYGPPIEKVMELNPLKATNVVIREGFPRLLDIVLDNSSDLVVVEIPGDLSMLKKVSQQLVLDWRLKLRRVFEYYINSLGYTVVGFTSHVQSGIRRSYYILWRRSLDEILDGAVPWS